MNWWPFFIVKSVTELNRKLNQPWVVARRSDAAKIADR